MAIKREQYILGCLVFLMLAQGVNTAITVFYGSEPSNELELGYQLIFYILTTFYIKYTGFRMSGSFDYGFFFLLFYPILVPYVLIKRNKISKGLAFIAVWFIAMNITYFTWILVYWLT